MPVEPVELRGVSQLRSALRKFEPDLSKELQNQMKGELKPIVAKARGFMPKTSPLRNWKARAMSEATFPAFDPIIAKRGISFKTTPSKPSRRGFSYAASIWNKSASGAIFETAGRKNGNSGKSARPNFSAAMQRASKLQGSGILEGRAIFAAWAQDRGKAQDAVQQAIKNSARRFKDRMGVM